LSYIFSGTELFTTFNNTPNLNNVKNDFSVWGTKGETTPIHMRYAIDKKPVMYNSIEVKDEDLKNYNIKHGFNLKKQSSHLYIIGEKYLSKGEEESSAPSIRSNLCPVARTPMGTLYLELDTNTLCLEVTGEIDKEGVLLFSASSDYDEETKFLTIKSKNYTICDWRELIYQMALDYSKYNHLDDFE
jgi:hypothetical protein